MKLRASLWVLPPVWLLGVMTLSAAEPSVTNEACFLRQTRQLTFEGRRAGEGYFSPDGRALVFQSEREPGNPFYQIYLLDLESGDSRRLSPGAGKTTCSFFRPGTDEVLFASTHLDPEARAKQKAELDFRASGKERRYSWDYDEHMELFSVRRDGSGLRRLTDAPGYDAEGAYSPDGKRIVFSSLRGAYPTNRLSAEERKRLETDPSWFGDLYLMNADGTGVRRLTHAPGYDGGPFFSPDGQRVLWRRFDEKGNADIFTVKLDGSDERRLTDFSAMSWAPFFHPSGDYVIFTANKLGFANFELFLVDAAGAKEPVRVTFTDGFDGLPVFAPDGRRLCWTSNRAPGGQSQLFLADWDDAAARSVLAAAPARGAGATPSPPSVEAAAAVGSHATRNTQHASPDITAAELRPHVEFLAADALEGRMTGSTGALAAARYLARELEALGLKPAGTNAGFFHDFEFNAGARVLTNANRLTLTVSNAPPRAFEVEKDFRPLSFTDNAEVEGEVVFAGYGLRMPGKPGEGYDAYAGVEVSNKIVLALRYVPEEVEPKRRAELNRYAGLRYKAMQARERGARAILFVAGPNSPNAGALVPLASDGALSGSGIIAASISSNLANALFAAAGRDLKSVQSALDKEDPHAEAGFVLPGARLRLAAAVEHLKQSDRNVVAALPPAGHGVGPAEYILVGAHYDHLGRGEAGAMGRQGEEHLIHNGADDNASGCAAVLELAQSLAAARAASPAAFPRGILFAFWSGEELGLLGSSHFAEHPPLPLSNIVACLNFDMVGRLRDNKLILQGAGSSPHWRRLIEKRNVAAGFNLAVQDDPYLPTDVTAFYPKGVPVLNFFTGGHEDYHRPTDKPATLDYDGTARIAQLARAILLDLAAGERPGYAQVARSDTGSGSRENLRAYLGTIPDYATEVTGVKISGARAGSPADKAGLKAGDVIVEFSGQKVANIYDYTYALDAVKIGQPVKVVVLRAGQRVELTVVPEARK